MKAKLAEPLAYHVRLSFRPHAFMVPVYDRRAVSGDAAAQKTHGIRKAHKAFQLPHPPALEHCASVSGYVKRRGAC